MAKQVRLSTLITLIAILLVGGGASTGERNASISIHECRTHTSG